MHAFINTCVRTHTAHTTEIYTRIYEHTHTRRYEHIHTYMNTQTHRDYTHVYINTHTLCLGDINSCTHVL